MSLAGHGVDIIEMSRVERLLENPDDDWLLGAFSETERSIALCSRERTQFFAGRFAAKEAVGKALGVGISGDIAWKDIEILRDGNGAPIVSLSGEALNVANALGITRWLISISHTETYAVASAIAVTE